MISVCMITWNEESMLASAVESTIGLAREIVVVDTGSTDGTVELAKELGCKVVGTADRMHKGNARNQAIDAAYNKWVIILDADERIADPIGLRRFLENTDAQAVYVKLAYVDSGGNFTLSYQQMRCWRKHAFRYKYRAHEVPVPTNGWGKVVHTDFVWEHRPPGDRSWKRQYTLARLLLDVEENPGATRPLYYLGRQYMYCEQYEDAIETLTKYLELRQGRDQADAWRCLAICYAKLENRDEQVRALFQACAERPMRRDWWGQLAEIYHAEGQDEIAAGLLKCALEIPLPERSYAVYHWYGPHTHDLLARCFWKLRRYEEGRKQARRALELAPTDKRLLGNLKWFENKLQPTKIFITGCAKSGTTLLRRLFYAFDDVRILPDETHIRQFVKRESDTAFLVGKRHRYSLFSEHLTDGALNEQKELIQQHNVKVVNIIRDGRDVIHSGEGYVSPRRWIEAMRQRDDLIAVEVRYEDIVSRPDKVQKKVADKLGLSIAHKWSEYPDFVPDAEFVNSIYAKRPLDKDSVGIGSSWRGAIDDIAAGFEEGLIQAGYAAKGPEHYDAAWKKKVVRPGKMAHIRKLALLASEHVTGSVLDLGCGTGELTRYLDGSDYLGVDFSEYAIEHARKEHPERSFVKADIRKLTMMCRFDSVVMLEVLEHLDDPMRVCQKAMDLADERIIISVPVNMPDKAHVKPKWERADIEALFGELSFCERVLNDVYWLAVADV